jgi:hypothetical protein
VTAGVHPGAFSRAAEARTDGGRPRNPALAAAGWGVQRANQAGGALAGRMEQTAGHAGMQPHSIPATTGGRPNPLPRLEAEG